MVATKSNEPSIDKPGWLTREQASDLLGVSQTTIKKWQEEGLLSPVLGQRKGHMGQRELWLYDPRELAGIPRRKITASGTSDDPGEIAARAFERFDDGVALRGVVVALRIPPERAADLHDQWSRMGGADLVVTPAARRELVQLVGEFQDVAGLIAAVRSFVDSVGQEGSAP